jgi:hypothetical protein
VVRAVQDTVDDRPVVVGRPGGPLTAGVAGAEVTAATTRRHAARHDPTGDRSVRFIRYKGRADKNLPENSQVRVATTDDIIVEVR